MGLSVLSRWSFAASARMYTESMSRLHEVLLLARSLRDERARVRYILARARRSARNSRRVVSVTVPGFAFPIWLRAGGSDYFTFHQVFTDRHYQHGLSIAPNFIIDAGANVGFSSIYFAREYPKAKILAIEPDEGNFDLLIKNTEHYPNIQCFKGALWPTEAAIAIENPDAANPAAYAVRPIASSAPHALRAFTPLGLLHAARRERIDLFKIDIEGAELELFSHDSEQWINKTGVIMVELHDAVRPGCGEAFFKSICRQRFNYFQRSETSIVQFNLPTDDAEAGG